MDGRLCSAEVVSKVKVCGQARLCGASHQPGRGGEAEGGGERKLVMLSQIMTLLLVNLPLDGVAVGEAAPGCRSAGSEFQLCHWQHDGGRSSSYLEPQFLHP